MNRQPPYKRRPRDETNMAPWQYRLHEIIFEADTRAGRAFDIVLFLLIGLSVLAVMLESVAVADASWAHWRKPLYVTEWILTILFTIEYVLRLLCVGRPWRYVFSFFGLVDLLSIVPTYLSIFADPYRSLAVIRSFRLIRVFRVLKLAQYLTEAQTLLLAFHRSRAKITVFFLVVTILVLILGALMYGIEGGVNGEFTSIPKSVYWAIVTVTTVGYGDIAPKTVVGQTVAALAMILGYSIIVVPTGFTLAEMISVKRSQISTQVCPNCSREGHDTDAVFCKFCGFRL